MSRPPKALIPQEPYVRTREDPFFAGLLRSSSGKVASRDQKVATFDFQQKFIGPNITGSISDMGDIPRTKNLTILDIFDESTDSIAFNDNSFSGSENFSKITKTGSFELTTFQNFDTGIELSNPTEALLEISESPEEVYQVVPVVQERPAVYEKTYEVQKRLTNSSKFPPLPLSAASFYNGFFPNAEIVESSESIKRLNSYLRDGKDEVSAGVPGKFLHAVLGQDISDIGSITSTIMYAFYLNETLGNHQFSTVPVINLKRAELDSHAELKWLLDSCQIDESSLIFVDEIDLSYYDLFGSLKLVLMNGHKLPIKQEALKEAVVEIFNCSKGELVYPWVETLTFSQDASSCTCIAEKFLLTTPEILTSQGFGRLLLAGILMDTGNLSSPHCTNKDKFMATLLLNGAGRFGCNGLYQILRHKMYDISDLRVIDILRKDFKKWTRVGKQEIAGSRLMVSYVGLSSIGISLEQLLAHNNSASEEIKYFQQLEKLRLLMVVSGYYDSQRNFKREILVAAESVELMKNLLVFLNSNASQLPLKVLNRPGLKDEMRAFEIDKVTSRKTIERLLEEFGGASRA